MEIEDNKLKTANDLINKSVAEALDSKLDGFLAKIGDVIDEKVEKSLKANKSKEEADKQKVIDEAAKLETDKLKADADKATKTDNDTQSVLLVNAIKTLNETVKSLKAPASEPQKKGAEGEYEEETKADATPKKTLKSVTDVDTLKYVFHLGENEKEYKNLDEEEKEQAKSLMFSAYVAGTSK